MPPSSLLLTALLTFAGIASSASSTSLTSSSSIALGVASAATYDEEPGFGDPSRAQSCSPVPIRVPMCADILYNTTASYAKQKEVSVVLQHLDLDELVRLRCAPYMRLFACSMHLPFCNRDQSLLVRPCREFCESVRQLCVPVLLKIGYNWPTGLACDSLPLERVGSGARKNLCLRPNTEEFNAEASRLPDLVGRDQGYGGSVAAAAAAAEAAVAAAEGAGGSRPRGGDQEARWPNASGGSGDRRREDDRRRRCSSAELTVGTGAGASAGRGGGWCARRCLASFMFAREDRDFASAWMLAWSAVCLACTGLALATFALDARRFRYPERPVVWVAACHMVHSGAHLLRSLLGPELACSRPSGGDLALVSRHAGQWCAAVFLLLYFSWLAGLLWWLALAVSWYLSAVKRWSHQLLAERAVWLHLLAWGAPLLLSVVVLVLHRIEGDELTHLCVVDGSRPVNLLVFQVAPVVTALTLGLAFLVAALRSVVSSSAAPPQSSLPAQSSPSPHDRPTAPPDKAGVGVGLRCSAEQQAAKICLFSFLFVLPTACVLATNVYELLERPRWSASLEAVLARPGCVGVAGLEAVNDGGCGLDWRPSAAFYMLRIFMSLTAGLPAGLVVWANGQSASAWRRCLCWALARRRSGKSQQLQQHQPHPDRQLQHHQLPQLPSQQQQQQLHHQQSLQRQGISGAYSTVDSAGCGSSPQLATTTAGRPVKQHHVMMQQQHYRNQQQSCMSDV